MLCLRRFTHRRVPDARLAAYPGVELGGRNVPSRLRVSKLAILYGLMTSYNLAQICTSNAHRAYMRFMRFIKRHTKCILESATSRWYLPGPCTVRPCKAGPPADQAHIAVGGCGWERGIVGTRVIQASSLSCILMASCAPPAESADVAALQ